jgi:hypothetical protein
LNKKIFKKKGHSFNSSPSMKVSKEEREKQPKCDE